MPKLNMRQVLCVAGPLRSSGGSVARACGQIVGST
jgi:hypothetical protein